jgi:hypothetical protein
VFTGRSHQKRHACHINLLVNEKNSSSIFEHVEHYKPKIDGPSSSSIKNNNFLLVFFWCLFYAFQPLNSLLEQK